MPRKRKEPRVPAKIEPELARISSGFDLFAMGESQVPHS